MMSGRLPVLLLLLAWLATTCTPASNPPPAAQPATAEPTVAPPTAAPPTPAPPTPAPAAPFAAATYRDETAGFQLSYPETWTLDDVDPAVKGTGRGYYAQLTSWAHTPGDLPEVNPPGSSRLDIVVQQWDPKNNLPAFIETRKTAWSASGFTLVAEENWTLPDGRPAVRFVVQTTENEQAYFMFSANEEIYLTLSGSGDLELLDQIGQTLQWSSAS